MDPRDLINKNVTITKLRKSILKEGKFHLIYKVNVEPDKVGGMCTVIHVGKNWSWNRPFEMAVVTRLKKDDIGIIELSIKYAIKKLDRLMIRAIKKGAPDAEITKIVHIKWPKRWRIK